MLGTGKARVISMASASSEFTDSLCIQDKGIIGQWSEGQATKHQSLTLREGSGSAPFILTHVLGAPVPQGIHRQQLLTSFYATALEFSHFSNKTI